MDLAVAFTTLTMTVSLAVLRPRLGLRDLRFTPGSAAAAGVLLLLATGLLAPRDLATSFALQWRPLLALTSIMVLTGVVQEVGAFDRLASWIEARARSRSIAHTFTVVFALSAATAALLNNDAAILILTPLVIALTRRLYPGNHAATIAFAFAVFLAPGVAPLIVSNPMNMIVAEFAGLDFGSYALVMAPISIAGALLTYLILRWHHRALFASTRPARGTDARPIAHRAERPVVALLVAVFLAYPAAALLGVAIWAVAVAGAIAALALARRHDVAPVRRLAGHVSLDILVFLWGIFLVVQGLRGAGVIDGLAGLYQTAPAGSGEHLALVGTTSAVGSALVDNHPMSILNMMALESSPDRRPLLAALIGGDIGPRLLPIGSLAGLLWMNLLRRAGLEVGVATFARVGALVVLPTLAGSLALLWLL